MTKYVGLLRGVNVGGVNMKMAELASVVDDTLGTAAPAEPAALQ